MQNAAKIRADFDTLAQFSEDGWSHNSHYHAFLLKHLPNHIERALDIGSGSGLFSRLLAERADHVTGFDLSPKMVEAAKSRSTNLPNVEYRVQDVIEWDTPTNVYDCIASIATLHHIPARAVYPKIVQALKPGGVLLVLDLFKPDGFLDLLKSVVAMPISFYYKQTKNNSAKPSPAESAAWEEHGKTDVYPTMREVHQIAAKYLPGAQVRQHLLWRYSIVWHKKD